MAAPKPLPADHVPASTWITLIGVILGAFMAILDIQITNSSLREIQGALSATIDEASWISTSYLVAEIIIIPISGWLSQVFSLRKYLIVNVILFLIFSVLCATAWNLPSMIVFRACQGLTGGTLIPLAFSVILRYLPMSQRPKGMALFTLTATFAPAIGPTIGGWLTDNFGWEYIFYLNIIPGIIQLLIAFYAMKQDPMDLNLLKKGDWWGIGFMAIGLGALEIFLEEGSRKDWFDSEIIQRLFIVAVVFLTLFLIRAFTAKYPVINLRLLKYRNFGLGSIINVTLGFGLYGSVYVLPLFLGEIQHFNPLQIGQVIMWLGMPQLLIIPLIPIMMKKFDGRIMLGTGVLLFATSCFLNANLTADTPVEYLHISQVIRAFGQPLIFAPLSTLITADLPGSESASGSSLFNMMRNLGGSIGIALMATLLTNRELFHNSMINESVNAYSGATQERLQALTQGFINGGMDAWTAQMQAMAVIKNVMTREAMVMAFNDCFWIMSMALLASFTLIFFLKKADLNGNSGEAH